MDIKEEDPLSVDIDFQNESALFIKKKTDSNTVHLKNDYNMMMKTEIKSESSSTDCSSQKERDCFGNPLIDQINFKTFSSNNNCKMEFKNEIGSEEETEFLLEDSIVTYNDNNEIHNKIEVKEETWWQNTETSSAINDGAFIPVKSPRLSGDSFKMDIKEEDPLSVDIDFQNESVLFIKKKTDSNIVHLKNDYNMMMKTEIKSESSSTDCSSQKERDCFGNPLIDQINFKTFSSNNNCKMEFKNEIGSEEETEFLLEDSIVTYNDNNEIHNKIEVKEETWWQNTETSSAINDGAFTPVKSPRLRGNSFKIDIKEEDPLSVDTVHLKNDYSVMIKPEIKSESPFTDCSSQKERDCFGNPLIDQINFKTFSSNNNCKTEFKKGIGSEEEREFLPEDSIVAYDEIHTKIDVKEETWWQNTETSSAINDGAFTPVKSPRLYIEPVSGVSSTDSALSSTEASMKNSSSSFVKERLEFESQQRDVSKIPAVVKHGHPAQSHKCTKEKGRKASIIPKTVERSCKCNNCERTCTHISNLAACNSINDGKIPHKCEICEKRYTQLSHLKTHKLIQHDGKRPHKCEICEKRFTQLSHLKSHKLIHDGIKPYRCEICERRFTRTSALRSHILRHEGKKPHRCEICEKSFTLLAHLKTHKLIHDGIKPYRCEICEKRFTGSSALKSHILSHEGKRPHRCDICEKRFTQLSHLKTHKLTHDGVKPYKCEICETRFIWLSGLKVHILAHEGKRPHKCEICEKRFTRLSDLRKHSLIHDGKRSHKCEICGKRFILLSKLKRHNLIHDGIKSHKCEICEKRFTQLSALKIHKLIHDGIKPHKCEICKKSYTQLAHLKTHSLLHGGIKPHKCEICEKRFTRLVDMRKHSLIHKSKEASQLQKL